MSTQNFGKEKFTVVIGQNRYFVGGKNFLLVGFRPLVEWSKMMVVYDIHMDTKCNGNRRQKNILV